MGNVQEVNESSWKREVLESDLLTVVDFWHEHCPWCLKLNPILEEVAGEYKGRIKFVKLNVLESQENREIAIEYGIMSTPTLMFFCGGRPVEGVVGFMSKDYLRDVLDDMLKRHKECFRQSTELKT